MTWSTALPILIITLIAGVLLIWVFDRVAGWLYPFHWVKYLLAHPWLLMGVNILVIFFFPACLCLGLSLLAIQWQNSTFAAAAFVLGFSSILLVPYCYGAILIRLRKIDNRIKNV